MRSLTLLSKTKIRRRPQTVLSEIADRCGRHGGEPDLRRDGRGGAAGGLPDAGSRRYRHRLPGISWTAQARIKPDI
jgi:hypothetical protein